MDKTDYKIILLIAGLIGMIVVSFSLLIFISRAIYMPKDTETIVGTVSKVSVDKNEVTIYLTNGESFIYQSGYYDKQQVPLTIGVTYQFDLSVFEVYGIEWYTLKSVTQIP